jgi:hypothetical protein
MAEVKWSQAIKDFLDKNTWPDLATLYNSAMECQVNVAQDGGELISREYKGKNWREYTDGIQIWKPKRIPLNSMTVPENNDDIIRFDLALHVEGIGMTGFDFLAKRARHVAFDFDAILGHSEGHSKKLTPAELAEIREKVSTVEWVTLRKSTGGNGLHVYVHLDFEEEINNHNEHAAVGRAILSQLSAIAGFDFESKVDVNSGNMWIWHRKMILPDGTRNPNGLALIKQGTRLKDVPKDWRDHLDVVSGRRKRAIPFFVKDEADPQKAYDEFEELSNQRPKVPLDKDHKRLLDWIQNKSPGGSWWREDHHMLVTHTFTLKQAHAELGLRGPFDTVAQGEQYGADWNAFAFPMINGSWTIRRYTRGCAEAPTWEQDGQGFTRCFLNKVPDFKLACKLNGGIEKPNGGFVFPAAHKALDTAKMLGSPLTLPDRMHHRSAVLKQHKDKRLIIELPKDTTDTGDGMEGYDGTGKTWNRIFDAKVETTQSHIDTLNLDKVVRHIVNEGGRDEGWVVKSDGEWRDEPLEHVKLILKGHFGYKPNEMEQILGTGAIGPYKLVNRPFDVEYPPGRLWNRRGAKLAFEPSQNIDDLKFPTWQRIMTHLGTGLDPFIKINPWAKANGVISGADYLIIWVAALFQEPYQRLPYLFFFSEDQNTGKSTYHEAISLLMEGDPPRGYMKVNEALKAASQFNAELQHALLCVVEELDLNPKRSDAQVSYNRIKELVTANSISIHEKRQTPCMVKNTTHWIQASNNRSACPIFKNDSRITMIRVEPIDDIDMIPKFKLMEMLLKEGPDFLAHILRLEIPPSGDRLLVPVIETEDKRSVQSANATVVEQFIKETCHIVDGEMIVWSEFYDTFLHWMEPADCERWTKRYTGTHLPDYHPRGRRRTDNQYCIANLSWKARDPDTPIMDRLVLRDERLVPLNSISEKLNGNTRSPQDLGAGSPQATKDGP